MGRTPRSLAGLALLVVSVVLGLYGLFAVLYRGDSGGTGDTYVTFGGHQIDGQLAGAVALLISFVALLVGGLDDSVAPPARAL